MATLKEHQAAMVDMLADGSGIPASASRLAHAMHDALSLLTTGSYVSGDFHLTAYKKPDATTPGHNDKALSKRVKELENTIRQLKVRNRELKVSRDAYKNQAENFRAKLLPEQSGCRKPDTQCLHTPFRGNDGGTYCADCGEEL